MQFHVHLHTFINCALTDNRHKNCTFICNILTCYCNYFLYIETNNISVIKYIIKTCLVVPPGQRIEFMFMLVAWLTENFSVVLLPAHMMSHTIIQLYPLETNTKTKGQLVQCTALPVSSTKIHSNTLTTVHLIRSLSTVQASILQLISEYGMWCSCYIYCSNYMKYLHLSFCFIYGCLF